jgi:FKBP-type peptidyl-prolyl cis-trans isomerase FklB
MATETVVTETVAAENMNAVTVCPDAMIVGLDAYPEETLPETEDFAEWHIQNAARTDVQKTASGLQYKVAQAGIENGVKPNAGESITANYHGYFPNGEVFDSSYERDSPMTHKSNGFIPGWNEALADMAVCEARTLYIPANLAYGNSGAGGRPTGTLVFNMQLLSVNR